MLTIARARLQDIGVELIGLVKPKRGPRAFTFRASKTGSSHARDDLALSVTVEPGAFADEAVAEAFEQAVAEHINDQYPSFDIDFE